MSAQGLLNSVFSKPYSKRKLRQTRSLDPALIGNYGTVPAGGFPAARQHLSSSSLLASSESCVFHADADARNPAIAKGAHASAAGSPGAIFSPRRWLQKKQHHPDLQPDAVWLSEGDFTWNSTSGRSVRLQPVPIQGLSELERVRLQEVAFNCLHLDYHLGCQITIPKDCQKRKKSLRRKLDSLAKEKNKDKEFAPQAFGMPLSQVIANDRTHKQRQEAQREELRDPSDPAPSIMHLTSRRPNKELSSSNSSLSSTSEAPNESTSPGTPEAAPRARRRGAMSVDCITDLDDSESRLLEALQLSLPTESASKKEKHQDAKLSLNPIYRQVPRLVDCCCQHLEKFGLQTVGIFRVGSSKKRVRQLRDEFDQGLEVPLDEEHSVHDIAALLKEFLRDMPDPLLTRELYTAFINCMLLDPAEQQSAMQLLIFLLPACNSDTLHRLLEFLSIVAGHSDDSYDKDGQEIAGNKMTSVNLATIFGPNLLHKQKSSDKEFMVQSSARAEESTVIIGIVQRMIDTYETLFTVPPDLQHEVLMSLLETDPDVVDYLLRRKASHSGSPGSLRPDDPFSMSDRQSSSESNKASSGEVSPYDNNSPVLSDWLPPSERGDDRLHHRPDKLSLEGPVRSKTCLPPAASEDQANIWGTWHATLKSGFMDPSTGLHGSISECSRSSAEGPDSQHGRDKSPVWRTHTSLGVAECRTHPPVTRVSSSPQSDSRHSQPLRAVVLCSQPTSSSLDDITLSRPGPAMSFPKAKPVARSNGRPPPPYPGLNSSQQQPPAPPSLHDLRRPPQSPRPQREALKAPSSSKDATVPGSPEWQDWQRDKWQIWQLLSSDSADSLPETLV
ncbi:rho GTPase-activating protein 6 isoform X2 [Denticeps clupeoides]|uniref:rho GTPase-activating protein 6 isoform X2 n=1 Tax=Denticeps clupeoides TaxID=299321 RepID=UPI0010A5212D|nr:rho GTPase-activating protein 6-like isoform X2 [Denticeps clupeoides]